MKSVLMVLWVLLCAAVVAAGYVRLAPSNPRDWHTALDFGRDRGIRGGLQRVVQAEPGSLARLDAIIRATPRTRVLAGSPAEGRVTYVTRSRIVGFPDYTTVEQGGGLLRIFARQRFGSSDFGVNAARVAAWLGALQAGG